VSEWDWEEGWGIVGGWGEWQIKEEGRGERKGKAGAKRRGGLAGVQRDGLLLDEAQALALAQSRCCSPRS
jgi:hypothetical protein